MAFFVAASADSHVETLLNKLEAKFKTKLQAFRYLDESNNGYVTADDFAVRYRRMGFELSQADAQRVVERFSGDGAQRVSFDDFARLYDHAGMTLPPPPEPAPEPAPVALSDVEKLDVAFSAALKAREPTLREAFLSIDQNRTGFLTSAELAAALARCGIAASTEQTEALCALYDLTDNNKISYAEFAARVRKRARQYRGHLDRQQDDLLAGHSLLAPVSKAQAPPPPREPRPF